MSLSSQPNEELMKNKEVKAEALSLAIHKAQREQGSFLLFSHT